jgi:hypothetical protein
LATVIGTEIIGGGPEDPVADAAVVAEIEAAEAAEVAEEGLVLLHGTDAVSAANIVENGLNVAQAAEVGGGDIFWTTTSLEDAQIFAAANPAGGTAAIVQMQISQSLAESLIAEGQLTISGSVYKFSSEAWEILNESASFTLF